MPPAALRVGVSTAPATVERAANRAIELSRKRFDKLTQTQTSAALGPVLKRAYDDLAAKLAALGGSQPFTAVQAASARLQIRVVADRLAKQLGTTVEALMGTAQAESVHSLMVQLQTVQKALGVSTELPPIPLREVARLKGVGRGGKTSLLQEFHDRGNASALNYGQTLIGGFEDVVAHGLAVGMDVNTLSDDLLNKNPNGFAGAWWKAERIARTEVSWAYNTSSREASEDLAEEYPDVLNRWTEYVDDDTRTGLDERVGEDSIRLHGQLRRPGDAFHDPVNRRDVTEPPNRPNDRATITVWRASWGEPPGGLAPLDAESRAAFAGALKAIGEKKEPAPPPEPPKPEPTTRLNWPFRSRPKSRTRRWRVPPS